MAGSNEELRARQLDDADVLRDVIGDFPMMPSRQRQAIENAIAALAPTQEPAGGGEDGITRDDMLGYVDACAEVLKRKGKPIMARELSAIARRLATPTPQAEPAGGGESRKPSDAAIADAFWAARARINATPSCLVDPAEVRWGDEIVRAARLATPTPQTAGVSDANFNRAWTAFQVEHGSYKKPLSDEALKAGLVAALTAAGAAPEGFATFEQWYESTDARFWNNWDACNAAFAAGRRAASPQPGAQEQSA